MIRVSPEELAPAPAYTLNDARLALQWLCTLNVYQRESLDAARSVVIAALKEIHHLSAFGEYLRPWALENTLKLASVELIGEKLFYYRESAKEALREVSILLGEALDDDDNG
jgi:hypothetical protein